MEKYIQKKTKLHPFPATAFFHSGKQNKLCLCKKKKMPSRRNLGHHLKDLNRCKAGIRIWTILIRWNKLNYFPFFNSDRIFSFLQNNILNRCTVSHCSVLIFIIKKKTVNIDFYLMIQIRVSAKLCGSGYRPPLLLAIHYTDYVVMGPRIVNFLFLTIYCRGNPSDV